MSTPALQTLLPEVEASERPSPIRSSGGSVGTGVEAPAERSFLDRLSRMTSGQRLGMYREGGFTRHERAVWASRYPDEVPMVNDEFEWIALGAADLD